MAETDNINVLTLEIYNCDSAPAGAPQDMGSAELLFKATNLSWAKIIDFWDECIKYYNKKYFLIKNTATNSYPDTGLVVKSAEATFSAYAEKEPNCFIGNIQTSFGNQSPLIVDVNGKSEEEADLLIKKATLTELIALLEQELLPALSTTAENTLAKTGVKVISCTSVSGTATTVGATVCDITSTSGNYMHPLRDCIFLPYDNYLADFKDLAKVPKAYANKKYYTIDYNMSTTATGFKELVNSMLQMSYSNYSYTPPSESNSSQS